MVIDVAQYMGISNGWTYWRLFILNWTFKDKIYFVNLISISTDCKVFKKKIAMFLRKKYDKTPRSFILDVQDKPSGQMASSCSQFISGVDLHVGRQAQRAGLPTNNVGLGWVKLAHCTLHIALRIAHWLG